MTPPPGSGSDLRGSTGPGECGEEPLTLELHGYSLSSGAPPVMSLDVAEGQIQGVSSIINPDKLRHLGPLADLGALLRERS